MRRPSGGFHLEGQINLMTIPIHQGRARALATIDCNGLIFVHTHSYACTSAHAIEIPYTECDVTQYMLLCQQQQQQQEKHKKSRHLESTSPEYDMLKTDHR